MTSPKKHKNIFVGLVLAQSRGKKPRAKPANYYDALSEYDSDEDQKDSLKDLFFRGGHARYYFIQVAGGNPAAARLAFGKKIRDSDVVASYLNSNRALDLLIARPEFWKNKEVVIALVKQNWQALEWASVELQNDKEVVMAAVKHDGDALEWASVELQNDKEVVMTAIKEEDGWALKYASVELQNDKEVVMAAVKEDGWALTWASVELQNDKEVVMAAVQEAGRALQDASAALRNDREVVMAAVKQGGWALEYASAELQDDKEVVQAAGQLSLHPVDSNSDEADYYSDLESSDGYGGWR